MSRSKRLGEAGEQAACDFLRALGWEIVATNFRTRHGEIDIVAVDPAPGPWSTVVVVEVKTCRSGADPARNITVTKRRQLVRMAKVFEQHEKLVGVTLRFDVIAIDWSVEPPRILHYVGAFDAAGRLL